MLSSHLKYVTGWSLDFRDFFDHCHNRWRTFDHSSSLCPLVVPPTCKTTIYLLSISIHVSGLLFRFKYTKHCPTILPGSSKALRLLTPIHGLADPSPFMLRLTHTWGCPSHPKTRFPIFAFVTIPYLWFFLVEVGHHLSRMFGIRNVTEICIDVTSLCFFFFFKQTWVI